MSKKKLNIAVVGLGFGAEFIPIWQRHPLTNCSPRGAVKSKFLAAKFLSVVKL